MSCRSTAGGAVSTSLARAYTGLSDKEIQQIFHALKREGSDLPPPSQWQMSEWRDRQQDLLYRARRMTETKRDGLRAKLFRSRSEPVPDGGTFYAWSRIEARARQEVAIRAVADAVDLAPPGSQAHLYDLDADGKPARVWYASYGSNLHRDRFLTYIKGGSPEGSTRVYEGCRDQSLPEEDIPIRFAGARPHFALTSRIWRGGIAFIDTQKGESATGLGRAYAVSREQFEDVVAQENGFKAGDCTDIPYAEVLGTGRVVTGSGPYETLLHIGDYEGVPVLTFTAPFSTRDALGRKGQVARGGVRMPVLTNKPSPAYLRMIGSGLGETFGMDEVAQADYLRGCPGGDRYTRQEIVQILRGQDPASSWSRPSAGSGAWSQSGSGSGLSSTRADGQPTRYGTSPASGYGATSGTTATPAHHSGWSRPPQPPAATEPTQEGIYPPVKTYASGEERERGLRRWNGLLQSAKRNQDWIGNWVTAPDSRLAATPEAAEARRAEFQERHADAQARVAELTLKVRHAKAQSPANWYSAREHGEWYWRAERSELRHKVHGEERKHAAAQAALADIEANPDRPGSTQDRRNAAGRLTRAAKKIEHYQSRLDEIAGFLPDA